MHTKGTPTAEAAQLLLGTTLVEYSKQCERFAKGATGLPSFGQTWKRVCDTPKVRHFLAGDASSTQVDERITALEKLVKALTATVESLVSKLTKANARLDETQRTAAKRWQQLNADDADDEQPSASGFGRGANRPAKGAGRGRPIGRGREVGAAAPAPATTPPKSE